MKNKSKQRVEFRAPFHRRRQGGMRRPANVFHAAGPKQGRLPARKACRLFRRDRKPVRTQQRGEFDKGSNAARGMVSGPLMPQLGKISSPSLRSRNARSSSSLSTTPIARLKARGHSSPR